MKPSLFEIQKLVALTAFVTQKALLLAGESLFGESPADPGAVSQKRSQIDRLCGELAEQLASCDPVPPPEAPRALLLKALGAGLQSIGHDTDALAAALTGWNRPEGDALPSLHALYEGSAVLTAQAIGAFVEHGRLNLRDTVQNLCHNRDRLAKMEQGLSQENSLSPIVLPVRNISRHARRLAEEVCAFLAPISPAGSRVASPSPLPRHSQN